MAVNYVLNVSPCCLMIDQLRYASTMLLKEQLLKRSLFSRFAVKITGREGEIDNALETFSKKELHANMNKQKNRRKGITHSSALSVVYVAHSQACS